MSVLNSSIIDLLVEVVWLFHALLFGILNAFAQLRSHGRNGHSRSSCLQRNLSRGCSLLENSKERKQLLFDISFKFWLFQPIDLVLEERRRIRRSSILEARRPIMELLQKLTHHPRKRGKLKKTYEFFGWWSVVHLYCCWSKMNCSLCSLEFDYLTEVTTRWWNGATVAIFNNRAARRPPSSQKRQIACNCGLEFQYFFWIGLSLNLPTLFGLGMGFCSFPFLISNFFPKRFRFLFFHHLSHYFEFQTFKLVVMESNSGSAAARADFVWLLGLESRWAALGWAQLGFGFCRLVPSLCQCWFSHKYSLNISKY